MPPTFRDNQWNWTSLALHKSTASEVWRNIYFMVQVDFFLSLVFSICENATMPNCSHCLLFIWHVRMQWVFSIVLLYMWFLKSIWLNNNDQLQCSLLSYQSCLIIQLVHIYKGSSFCTPPFPCFSPSLNMPCTSQTRFQDTISALPIVSCDQCLAI